MPGTSSCPSNRDLLRLALGQLGGPEAKSIQQHVEQCLQCQETVREAGVEDVEESHMEEPSGLEETLIVAPVTGRAPAASRAAASAATAAEAPAVDIGVPLESLLKPPQGPGEIGRLGQYRVLKVIGSGATGIVFQAEDSSLRRTVALKVMKPLEDRANAKERFLREGRLAAAIEHDNVMTIYQVGEDDGVPYLAMQLLHGETLDERLKREPQLEIPEVLRIAREIADGLAAAHEKGLVHRDIKPANIWLEGRSGRVKLVDFGLARCLTDDAKLTKTGTVMGTPAYMAPEQGRGDKVDHRCDLFSLGGVIYRMVTGRTPFEAEDTIGMLMALAHEQPRPLKAFNEETPDALQGLVFWLLAKPVDSRPGSADEVIEVLDGIAEQYAAELARAQQVVPPRSNTGPMVLLMMLLAGAAFGVIWYWPLIMRFINTRLLRPS